MYKKITILTVAIFLAGIGCTAVQKNAAQKNLSNIATITRANEISTTTIATTVHTLGEEFELLYQINKNEWIATRKEQGTDPQRGKYLYNTENKLYREVLEINDKYSVSQFLYTNDDNMAFYGVTTKMNIDEIGRESHSIDFYVYDFNKKIQKHVDGPLQGWFLGGAELDEYYQNFKILIASEGAGDAGFSSVTIYGYSIDMEVGAIKKYTIYSEHSEMGDLQDNTNLLCVDFNNKISYISDWSFSTSTNMFAFNLYESHWDGDSKSIKSKKVSNIKEYKNGDEFNLDWPPAEVFFKGSYGCPDDKLTKLKI